MFLWLKSIQPYNFPIQFIIIFELPSFYYKENYAAIDMRPQS